jgi:hypothetical protein
VAAPVRAGRGLRASPAGAAHRRFAREGAPLGGRTSKIHCPADDRGRPVAFAPPPGKAADIGPTAPPLSAAAPPGRPSADKADDADGPRRWLNARRVKAVIPSTASRTVPCPLDRTADRRRNRIERLVCRLKNRPRIATRDDRLAGNDLAALALVAVAAGWT